MWLRWLRWHQLVCQGWVFVLACGHKGMGMHGMGLEHMHCMVPAQLVTLAATAGVCIMSE